MTGAVTPLTVRLPPSVVTLNGLLPLEALPVTVPAIEFCTIFTLPFCEVKVTVDPEMLPAPVLVPLFTFRFSLPLVARFSTVKGAAVVVEPTVASRVPVTCKLWLELRVAVVVLLACWNWSVPAITAVPLPVTFNALGVEPEEKPCSTSVRLLGMLSAVTPLLV